MDGELFDQAFGFGGVERSAAGVAIPSGKYCAIIPQEDVTITSITASTGFTASTYSGATLAKGIPFYIPFTVATFTGKVDCYKTIGTRASHNPSHIGPVTNS